MMRQVPRKLWLGAVLVATVIAYLPAMRGPFVFDDPASIDRNASIRSLWPLSGPLHPDPNTAVSGRPIVNLTLAINYAINDALGVDQRTDPGGPNKTVWYHVVNLLLHLACGLLLLGFLRRTLRAQTYSLEWSSRADDVAAVIAAVWLLHPLNTEAVDYVVQRTEILVSLFYLATLYASVRAWDAQRPSTSIRWMGLGVVTCLLGMGSKEVMVTAPLMVVLYDRAFRVNSWRHLWRAPRLPFYAALWATLAWSIALIASGARNRTVGFESDLTWYRYLYSQAWAILHYLQLSVWPAGLTIDYGTQPVHGFAGLPGMVLLGLCILVTVIAWTRVARWGWLAFSGAWFFLILGPSSSIVPITTEIAAERRMYLPLVAILVLCGVAIDRMRDRLAARVTPAAFAEGAAVVVALVLLGATTFTRSRVYASAERLWRDAATKAPDNPRALGNLGLLLMSATPPRLGEADSVFAAALAVDSTYAPAWDHRTWIAMQQGRADDEYQLLVRSLRIHPNHAWSLNALGNLLVQNGEIEAGIPYLEKAASLQPSDTALVDLGTAYMAVGRNDEALASLRAALEKNPGRTDALRFIGSVLNGVGRFADAVSYLEQAIARQPELALNQALLSQAYAGSNNPSGAARAADAVAHSPTVDALSLRIAGRAMLAAGRPRDAVQYLRESLRLSGNNPAVAADLQRAVRAASGSSRSPLP